MTSSELSKEEKLAAANTAREEVKQLLSFAKEGSVSGVRRRDCQFARSRNISMLYLHQASSTATTDYCRA